MSRSIEIETEDKPAKASYTSRRGPRQVANRPTGCVEKRLEEVGATRERVRRDENRSRQEERGGRRPREESLEDANSLFNERVVIY
mmetsp:Transcript_3688/g.6496  ORF Transcript_3688/g.6496 Transcript_3688/m.6496 type:complete len:86 (-) Transcript_3688:552-809(-)|eukprot:CAMPEP_0197442970 /NCGR_PEP_ID=MMETSP1175-20131217/8849_1 /TAXON_ID=1003142 /ORGANISM="Triceratium dubium, Strain CCMP147" /LENGTH=85 /DNA_ID=CAMNT_0042973543 /DNA_START=1263 /DNA_END=1520 /DNA_ORIENTATION=-